MLKYTGVPVMLPHSTARRQQSLLQTAPAQATMGGGKQWRRLVETMRTTSPLHRPTSPSPAAYSSWLINSKLQSLLWSWKGLISCGQLFSKHPRSHQGFRNAIFSCKKRGEALKRNQQNADSSAWKSSKRRWQQKLLSLNKSTTKNKRWNWDTSPKMRLLGNFYHRWRQDILDYRGVCFFVCFSSVVLMPLPMQVPMMHFRRQTKDEKLSVLDFCTKMHSTPD